MKSQTLARELALKTLYRHDLLGGRPQADLVAFCVEHGEAAVAAEAIEIVKGCLEHAEALDDLIRRTAENWDLERMAATDRNVLRIGIYELLFRHRTPPKVAIDEAIELAKKYSTQNSPTFVNGILDRIYTTRVLHAHGEGARPGVADGDPMVRCDLHVHSTASDGSVAPCELPGLAARAGLAAIALTDHDSVEGVAEAREAAESLGIELVPGIELTAYAPREASMAEVHIGGLFVDPSHPDLLASLRGLRRGRVERVEAMVRALARLGVLVDAEAVLKRSQGGAVGRVHVAQEVVARGYCSDLREVFDRYIGQDGPAHVRKKDMSPGQAIDLIHTAGGCAVLCHPGLGGGVDHLIDDLVAAGLDALEVHCPAHTAEDEKRYMDIARERGLLIAGGSDFHGEAKPDVKLGQEAVSGIELELIRRRASAPSR
ncbi:MAG: transcription antitermination factor NusB [Candidatus Brocadiaceae bacterium]|nr:transcription antitermination factor NusB [Candidatus Brocadiaceae bacterium]